MNDFKVETFVKIVVAVAVLFAVWKLMQGMGIIDDKDDRAQDKLMNSKKLLPITTADLKKHADKLLPTKSAALIAYTIYNADQLVDNDEGALAALKLIKSQLQMKQVSLAFTTAFGKDLAAYLNFMSDGNMRLALNYINSLPKM